MPIADPVKRAEYWKKYGKRHSEELKVYRKKYRETRKPKAKAYAAEYRIAHKVRLAVQKKKRYVENPEKVKNAKLLKAFGISLAQYNELLAGQKGQCAICGKSATGKRAAPVDHCHVSGKIRGVLCSNCNTGLGLFKDDVVALANAIKYLMKER